MKLKYVMKKELWIPNVGVFSPEQTIEVEDKDKAKQMTDSGYFKEIKERKSKESIEKGVD